MMIQGLGDAWLYLSDCLVGLVSGGEGDESVAAVHAGHGVHHQTEVPDLAALLEQRDQVVLVDVARNLATEDLEKDENIIIRMLRY